MLLSTSFKGLAVSRCGAGGQQQCSLLSEEIITRAVPVSTSPTKHAPTQRGPVDAEAHSWSTEVESRPESRGSSSAAAQEGVSDECGFCHSNFRTIFHHV